jgi:starch phosphorylase
VLAGDHLKSASDLGLPLAAVGILWRRGYTRQWIDKAGRQQDRFPLLRQVDTPIRQVTGTRGRPLRIRLPMDDHAIASGAWRLDVGRVPLYLLTTALPENRSRDRHLVDVLYSGDRDMRIRQEILLGIGGWRLLRALNIPVAAWHLNEGHAAFLSLERIAERIHAGRSFRKSLGQVFNTSVFTTHTPVPAGNEEFDPALVDRYLGHYVETMGITHKVFRDLARVRHGNDHEPFGMTPLALRTSRYRNGVAALHGAVARQMWRDLYPGKPVDRVPIGHVTNGIHLRTWLHPQMAALLEDFLGEDWESRQDDPKLWKRVLQIPDEALWDLHVNLKRELIAACPAHLPKAGSAGSIRKLLGGMGKRSTARLTRDDSEDHGQAALARATHYSSALNPEALTIGFARRFATYKRAALIFTDPDRLARIMSDAERPVQIIFAGKAHPADTDGKAVIQQVIHFTRSPAFRGRVVFLEDYEMGIARQMVAGVDVWLNNPQRPREASGTSGMKPALHGGLNLSILDGWWPEACNGRNGWAVGRGEDHNGTKTADRRDAAHLYRLLDREVVPMFYDRDSSGLPRRWIACMKNAMASIPPFFNTHRQVKEYFTKYYLPALRNARRH